MSILAAETTELSVAPLTSDRFIHGQLCSPSLLPVYLPVPYNFYVVDRWQTESASERYSAATLGTADRHRRDSKPRRVHL